MLVLLGFKGFLVWFVKGILLDMGGLIGVVSGLVFSASIAWDCRRKNYGSERNEFLWTGSRNLVISIDTLTL